MNNNLQASELQLLRAHVLAKAGIRYLSPGDCKKISIEIERTTKKRLSETTLKRFFGFASKKFNFSTYTIKTISQYLDMESLDHLMRAGENYLPSSASWDDFKKDATQISIETSTFIRKRCKIPFELTISRHFAELDMEFFLNSEYALTSFIAPPGKGKSVMLTHLATHFFLQEGALFEDDICLFVNCSTCHGLAKFENYFSKLLKKPVDNLGSDNILNYFITNPGGVKGRIVVVLDGFDEYVCSQEQLLLLINNISEILHQTEYPKWLKFIVSTRSSTWSHILRNIIENTIPADYVYPGIYNTENSICNIATFTNKELEKILENFHAMPVNTGSWNKKFLQLLREPYYLQLYWEKKQKTRIFNECSIYAYYDLVENRVSEQVLKAGRSSEKMQLLQWLASELRETESGQKEVEKSLLLKENPYYLDIYRELVENGILIEKKYQTNGKYKESIQFLRPEIYLYFKAEHIIACSEDLLDIQLLESLTSTTEKADELLCWVIRYCVKCGHANNANILFKFITDHAYYGNCLGFLINSINHEWDNNKKRDWFNSLTNYHNKVYEKIQNLDYVICANYQPILDLASNILSKTKRDITFKILETLSYALKLEKEKFINCYDNLTDVDPIILQEAFPLNPLQSLGHLNNLITGRKRPERTTAIDIEIPASSSVKALDENDSLAYKLAIIANNANRNYEASINIINQLKVQYPDIRYNYQAGSLWIFMLTELAVANLETGEISTAFRITEHLKETYSKNNETQHCDFYSRAILELLTVKIHLVRHEYKEASLLLKKMRKIELYLEQRYFLLQQIFLNIELYKAIDDYTRADRYLEKYLNLQKITGIDNLDSLLRFRKNLKFQQESIY